MKTIAIVQARMNSSRFPGKVLANLCGKPVIQHVIERVRESKAADRVVVATSENAADDQLAAWCSEFGVDLFRGSETDVLGRFAECAKSYSADVVLRVCGDSPLLEPLYLKGLWNAIAGGADYAAFRLHNGTPAIGTKIGITGEALTRYCLHEEHRLVAPLDDNREHVTRRIYTEPTRWVVRWSVLPDTGRDCAVDTFEDLQRVRGYMEEQLCASK